MIMILLMTLTCFTFTVLLELNFTCQRTRADVVFLCHRWSRLRSPQVPWTWPTCTTWRPPPWTWRGTIKTAVGERTPSRCCCRWRWEPLCSTAGPNEQPRGSSRWHTAKTAGLRTQSCSKQLNLKIPSIFKRISDFFKEIVLFWEIIWKGARNAVAPSDVSVLRIRRGRALLLFPCPAVLCRGSFFMDDVKIPHFPGNGLSPDWGYLLSGLRENLLSGIIVCPVYAQKNPSWILETRLHRPRSDCKQV